MIVQISPGRMGLIVGARKEPDGLAGENAFFLPRDVPHAVANRGDAPLEIISVAIR